MGVYLNPGDSDTFEMTVKSQAFVDKTEIVELANSRIDTEKRYVSMSRPRRFGKTVALNTLAAYYDRTIDSRQLFAGLKAEKTKGFADNLNAYDVLHVNIKQVMTEASTREVDAALTFLGRSVVRELACEYPDADIQADDNLFVALTHAYLYSRRRFVILIDEWDAPFRVDRNDAAMHVRYLDWLSGLLKDRRYVALCYVTGILPPQKYGEHSALNMFSEFSMVNASPHEDLMGFTGDEVAELCDRFGMDLDQVKSWYDGYLVGTTETYNPHAVTECVTRRKYWSYWTSTGRLTELERYITMDRDGLREQVMRMGCVEVL